MIILKKLRWSNCFSYGENNEVDLSSSKITQILGTNGVGKSSIPLILEEVLFNKNSKGIKKADIANRDIGKGYEIFVEFSSGEDIYTVSVKRKASLKAVFTKNGEDISSHTATDTYKNIQAVLGYDFKTFTQVVYQNTNNSLNFLTATDANRKKFLIDLLGLEKYVELFEVFKDASRQIDKEYAGLEAKVSVAQKWLENNKLSDTKPKVMKNLPKINEDTVKELASLQLELENISVTNRKILQNNTKKDLLRSIDINKINAMEAPEELISYDDLQSKLGEIKGFADHAKKEIKRIESTPDVCGSCGQDIPKEKFSEQMEHHRSSLETLKTEFDIVKSSIEDIKEANSNLREKNKAKREWSELYNSIDTSMPSEVLDEDTLSKMVYMLKDKIQEDRNTLEAVERENTEIAAHNARIEVILEQTANFESDLKDSKDKYDSCGERRSNIEILKKAFSTTGLIAYTRENLVKELEELTSVYLSELSDGRFTLNFAVNNDKLNVEVTDNGNVIDILALSSGELARVNTATLLAIRKLMNSLSSSKINVLFLDEVMNVLDESGREKLIEVLLEEELNTYLVSHLWSHPLLEKIEVQKHNNISRLVNG
jgi:DNA repair exonuclease SbcCD ATPase subunit